jgi:inositol-pentakisphosphate 2-kinase
LAFDVTRAHHSERLDARYETDLRTMDVDVSTTSPSEWQYTQEGGANLVLSYRGGGADWTGYALRLRKRARERSTPNTTPESRVDPEDWGQSVVRPLLGGDQLYLQPRVARLDSQWLDQVSQMLHTQRARPREREQEDEIDPTARTAVLVKDLIAGQGVLSIELKVRALPLSFFRVC